MEDRAVLPQTPESSGSMEIFVIGSCELPFTLGLSGEEELEAVKGRERGWGGVVRGWGRGTFLVNVTQLPQLLCWFLETLTTKDPSRTVLKQIWPHPPVHFLPSLALVTPIAKNKVAVTPQHCCGRKYKNKQN